MRCLITTWADSGHLRPLLPTTEALMAAGHDVLVASDPRIEVDPAMHGIPFSTFPDPATLIDLGDPTERRAALAKKTPEERVLAGLEHFVRQAEVITPHLVATVEKFRPDVIYREQSFFAGWLAGLITDVPTGVFSFFPAPRSSDDTDSPVASRLRVALRNVGAPGDLDSLDQWLTILAMPRSWVGDVPLTDTAHFVQPSDPPGDIDDGTAATLLAGLPDRPTVYVTLGTVFADTPGLFQMVLDGAAPLDINVIATIGSQLDTETLRVPGNTRIARFVPQTLLFPHCHAVVAHGGYGSLMGALRAGLPIVSLPVGPADNLPNAIRLELLGAGKALIEPNRSADHVTQALDDVLHEASYRTNARNIADEIAALPPPAHAAALLQKLATTRTPIIDPQMT